MAKTGLRQLACTLGELPQWFSSYDAKANAFLNDPRWCNGVSWGAGQKPKLSNTTTTERRDGDSLYTAEGNWTNGKVVVSNGAYTVNGNTLCRDGSKFRTFSVGYHMQ